MRTRTLVVFLAIFAAPARAEDATAFFERKIRPVLVEHCYGCHSAEAQAKKKLRGGLFVDSRKGLLDGGDSGPAVVPNKAAASLLYKSMLYDGDVRMPPRQKLPDAVIADFRTWIDKGAVDPRDEKVVRQKGMSVEDGKKFWSYRPLTSAVVPNTAGGRNAIDAFVRAKLDTTNLAPSPEADRATLIRRLSFDLTGLPPTPERLAAFVADTRVDAFERLVDELLASPAFGERWGRHWLDVARFGESLTLRGFVLKDAWRYRDEVVRSFDEDVPFDRFVRRQVAGDLLPAADFEERRRGIVSTSFLAVGNTNLEEQDKKQLRMDVVDEQLDTIGRAFLAQTIGCARCHDHKFDPIPTKDYYAMAGILRNTRTMTHANVSNWLNIPLPESPEREAYLRENEAAMAALEERIKLLGGKVVAKGGGAKKKAIALGDLPGVVVDDAKAKFVGAWVKSVSTTPFVGAGYVHDGNADKGDKSVTFAPVIPKTGLYEVRLAYTPGTNRAAKVPVTVFSADGEKTVFVDQKKTPPIDGAFISLGRHNFEKDGAGYVLVSNEGTEGHVIADCAVFIPAGKVPGPRPAIKGEASKEEFDLADLRAKLEARRLSGPKRETAIGIDEEKLIEDTRVHVRGIVHNLGETAPRGFLRVASWGDAVKMPAKESGRRELADWLASPRNPLTARVFVNRAWGHLFGEGIVRTVDNFGTTGETPSHPELLDHLAGGFIDSGWSVKALVRRIVLSETYRRSSTASDAARAADPENRLLSHANRRRLDAEAIRDSMLFAAGTLDRTRGGPSFKQTLASDYGFKHAETRRSVYVPVFRNSLPELFEAFDFADPSVSTGKRATTTVAPQALFLMNHPFVLAQAKSAAEWLPAGTVGERIEAAYRRLLGRAPSARERELVAAHLGETPDATAWAGVVQALMASLDFRYVE